MAGKALVSLEREMARRRLDRALVLLAGLRAWRGSVGRVLARVKKI